MKDALSIAVVCFPSVGGSGVIASELAAGLAERGHCVHVVASAPLAREVAGPSVRFHEVKTPGYSLFEHAPYTLAVASRLVDIARTERVDLIHAHYAVPHAASGYLARQVLGHGAPRLVTTLHGTDVTRIGSDPAYRSIVAATVAASDGITVPSEFLRTEAYARLELPASTPIEVLANFVDTDRFSPPPRKDRSRLHGLFAHPSGDGAVLFHVSNFRPVKRVADLIDVLARVRREVPARLVLVGDGPERIAAEARARTLGVFESVAFVGRRTDFVDWLRHADLFLLASETESFGVAALEALSAGVPVFAYRVGGLREVVPPEVGRLVSPFDVETLARAVVDAVSAPAALEAMGRAAREHVLTHFRRGPAIDRYEAFFRRVLEKRQEGQR